MTRLIIAYNIIPKVLDFLFVFQLIDDSSVSGAAVAERNHAANYIHESHKSVPIALLSTNDLRRNLRRRKRSAGRSNKHRRNLDSLGGGEVPLFDRRSFDSLGGGEIALYGRSFDSLGGGKVPLMRRSFDSLGGGELAFYDRSYDPLRSEDELHPFQRRNLDSLGGGEIALFDRNVESSPKESRFEKYLASRANRKIHSRQLDSLGGGEVPIFDRNLHP